MDVEDGRWEPCEELNTLSKLVIGAAIEVHRLLGPGYIESVYEEALSHELRARGIPFARQMPVSVFYKGIEVGQGRLDFLIDRKLVVELKAVEELHPIHKAQVISYLKSTQLPLGLLINFHSTRLRDGIQRVVLTN